MERRLNPELHIICGKCGSDSSWLNFELSLDGCDDGESIYPAIFISCLNCGTLVGLEEYVEDKTDWGKLGLKQKYEND